MSEEARSKCSLRCSGRVTGGSFLTQEWCCCCSIRFDLDSAINAGATWPENRVCGALCPVNRNTKDNIANAGELQVKVEGLC